VNKSEHIEKAEYYMTLVDASWEQRTATGLALTSTDVRDMDLLMRMMDMHLRLSQVQRDGFRPV
jgi:hypothetical protein